MGLGFLTSFLPGGGLFKYVLIGLAALAVYTTINGFWNYHSNTITELNQVIEDKDILIHSQQEQIAGLIIDKDRLILSNDSLTAHVANLEASLERAFEETQRILNSEAVARDRIRALEEAIADQVRQDRIAAIREGRRATLLLRFINSNVECFIDNFDRVDGTCIQGEWRPE